jgi:hypothetical protein
VHHSPVDGVNVANQGNLLLGVTTMHNLNYGLLADITAGNKPHRVIGLLSTENRTSGVYLDSSIVLRNTGVWANTHCGFVFHPFGGFNSFEGAFTAGLNGDTVGNYYTTDPAGCFNPNIPAIGDCYGSRATTTAGNPNGLLSLPDGTCDYDTNSSVTAPFNPPIRGPGYPFPERVRGGNGDAVNPSDGPDGNAVFANITNWVDFENFWRGWGAEGSATPSCESQGPCSATSTGPAGCQIYDYRLRYDAQDFIARAPSYPDGDSVLTHTFAAIGNPTIDQARCALYYRQSVYSQASQSCTVTFLDVAREIMGDLRGNENLLCESDEVCVFTPNMGSYQGEGPLVPIPGFVFQNGTISNVTLLMHETNGTTIPYNP